VALSTASCDLTVPGETWETSAGPDGFHYNVHRWYQPGLGRYTRPDPLRSASTLAAYRFAHSNPTRFSDPNGLQALPQPLPPPVTPPPAPPPLRIVPPPPPVCTPSPLTRNTSPRGTWTVIQDGGEAGTRWGEVTWNVEAQGSLPAGASITVEARAADTVAGLGGLAFLEVESGVEFALDGRFVEVKVTLRPNLDGVSPVLSDLEISTADLGLPVIAIDDVAVTEGDAGSVDAVFTLSLSAAFDQEVLVDYDTADASAEAGSDYLAASGRVAFAPGETSRQVSVEVLADLFDEPDETFLVELSLPQGATLADPQGVGTIGDDDPSAELDVAGVTVEEGDDGIVEAVFVLTLSAPSNRVVRIDYATIDDTATGGIDYRPKTGYLEIPMGDTQGTIAVDVFGDLEPEDDETFRLELSNPDGAVALSLEAVGTILDDDRNDLSIDGVTIVEGDSGTVAATFTVRLEPRPSSRDVQVDYVTVAGSATAGADYQTSAGTLTLAAGETAATFTVLVEGDVLLEGDETFTVVLSNPVEAVIVDPEGVGTIVDDEECPGPNLLANPGAELRPEDGDLPSWTPLPDAVWQRRLAPPEPVEGRATFSPGAQELAELWQDVDVRAFTPRIEGDGQTFRFEGFVRTFEEGPPDVAQIVVEYRDVANQVTLESFDSGQIASLDRWLQIEEVRTAPAGTGWIRVRLLATRFAGSDNDAYFDALILQSLGTATLTVGDTEVYESAGLDAVFDVLLSCPVDEPVSVDFATADGSAVAVDDYLANAGPLVFQPGDTLLRVPVPIVSDEVDEPTEMFHLDLLAVFTDSELVVTLDPRGDGRILDDDFCPRSPGFWKTHPEDWPVDYLELGGVEYEMPALLELLDYGGPDASIKLARQLVATKLNLAAGSDPFILPTVEAADLFLIDFPPGSNPRGQDKQQALALKDELEAYNNLDCEEGPVIALRPLPPSVPSLLPPEPGLKGAAR
jgi:RHS repeat-associated protein